MFYIVNCSGRHVSLSSLGVMLAPRQGIDLDSKFPRYQTEKCPDLKAAISKGVIKLVRKDGGSKVKAEVKEDKSNNDILLNIKKLLEDARHKDIDALASAVASRIGSVHVLSSNFPSQEMTKQEVVDEVIDSATMDFIHQKAVERMTKNVQGQTPTEQKSTVDIDIDRRLDELEGLL